MVDTLSFSLLRCREGTLAVQFALKSPPVLKLRSAAVPGVGVRRRCTCFVITDHSQRCSRGVSVKLADSTVATHAHA